MCTNILSLNCLIKYQLNRRVKNHIRKHLQKCENYTIKCLINVRRMCFPTFDAMKRTDSAFRNRQQPIHHKEYSLLEDLRNIDGEPLIDMIQRFLTSDPLHLLEEGVMKRLLRIWAKGTTIYKKKWSKPQIASFDINTLTWNKELPSDINRKVRVMQFVKFWKATEFRTILLYYGLAAFKDLLGAKEYIHFLHLCLAIRIYSCRT